ncbi:hypothetical protein [Helicobacter trogontum]|uniref:Uncharacterized protein n=2 Tax=Helicobacter trogontum TaxID=50960 RepID=A0ABQ0D2R0_9HELI|nr:hypothetical protein [Helicobacter trogontum]MCI5787401.1 hypothetical protein [Helicobacter trogontum]MDY5185716.1 hypothetical protein [Helicobacter trogontum]
MMLKIYAMIFITALCFFGYLSLHTATKIAQDPTIYEEIKLDKKDIEETFTIYTPKHIHTNFTCFQIAAPKVSIMQKNDRNSKQIQSVRKGQKLCFNFPQDIPNTTLQIILKEIESKWLRVTLVSDSVLLSGYIPIDALKDWQKIDSQTLLESSSGSEILLENAPKIISNNLRNIKGSFSMPHILHIVQDKLNMKDCEMARAWLALAQQSDKESLSVYDLYTEVLMCEGRNKEALALKAKLKFARNKLSRK